MTRAALPPEAAGQGACCADDQPRRARLRQAALNGIDSVEIDRDGTALRVTFLGKAPAWITPAHVSVRGAAGQRAVTVTAIRVDRGDDDGIDDVMTVWLDRPGAPGAHVLAINALDARGQATLTPPDFDPRYARAGFDFAIDCPGQGDCGDASDCPPETGPSPNIDYLARDFPGFRQLMLDRLALTLPEWRERHAADLGVTLVEAIAAVADQLSQYQDAVATEAYLGTARQRISVRRHARLVDYHLHEGAAARGWVALTVHGGDLMLDPRSLFFTTARPGHAAGMIRARDLAEGQAPGIVYELAGGAPVPVREARNAIDFHSWGETGCCLPRGATRATLRDPGARDSDPRDPGARDSDPRDPGARDRDAACGAARGEGGAPRRHVLGLAPGQVLIFAEVIGPATGRPEDADPSHRHAVRLTKAIPGVDPLDGTLIWEIGWCAADALPFPLCLDAAGAAPDCTWRDRISVAYGNVALASAGESRDAALGTVAVARVERRCATRCAPAEDRPIPARFRPRLPGGALSFTLPVPVWRGDCRAAAARRLSEADPATALPDLRLTSQRDGGAPRAWVAVRDLLGSGPDDPHVTVEIDDDGVAWLRFGDGVNGLAPEPGERFVARYRTGNGLATNIGADALALCVFRDAYPDGLALQVANPLPLIGGAAPEPTAHAKLAAPWAYRTRLERAIVATDYAAIVERDFAAEVQRAAAVMRRSGAACEVQVAIDPRGGGAPDPALLVAIAAHLERYRRIGHDVRVIPAHEIELAIALTLCVAPDHLREPVAAAARARLARLFAPDAWSFGDAIAASRIVAEAQAVAGVAHVTLDRLERRYLGPEGAGADGVLRLGAQQVPVLARDGLTLDVRGGR